VFPSPRNTGDHFTYYGITVSHNSQPNPSYTLLLVVRYLGRLYRTCTAFSAESTGITSTPSTHQRLLVSSTALPPRSPWSYLS